MCLLNPWRARLCRAQNTLRLALNQIAYVRGIFDSDTFTDGQLCGMKLPLLRKTSSPDSKRVIDMLEKGALVRACVQRRRQEC